MARLRGRAPKGERLRAAIPHGHWKTTTFVAGLRLSGMAAPMVLDGPINRDAFQAYVDQILVPPRRQGVACAPPELSHGDVVIMIILAATRGRPCAPRSRRRPASLLYLPPYSPDFNPIEKAFSKLKALLRKAMERTIDGLWNRIGDILDLFTPQDCANFFAAAGYDPD